MREISHLVLFLLYIYKLFAIYANWKPVFAHRELHISLDQRACVADEILCHIRAILRNPGERNGFLLVADLVHVRISSGKRHLEFPGG